MTENIHGQDHISAQEYYAGFTNRHGSLGNRFKDIDDEVHFHDLRRELREPSTINFVLDFGDEDAFCATNLEEEDLKLLLRKPVCLYQSASMEIMIIWQTNNIY